jgi:hypothetical protein
MDDTTRQLLADIQRDIDDTAREISQAVEKLEAGEATESEALLGEAATRLKLTSHRIEEHRANG